MLIDRELVKAEQELTPTLVYYGYDDKVVFVQLALIERNPTRAEAGT